jgi:spore coat polysaccharide biosynthesis protein SpsF
MTGDDMIDPNVERLEDLWSGDFGDDYVDRNLGAYDARASFWSRTLEQIEPVSVLEVGCNVGGNLRFIAPELPAGSVYGIDVNLKALSYLRESHPQVNAILSSAKSLPVRDDLFDLVFSMGVLIHQPEESIRSVISEMIRVSGRWVLTGEYFAEEDVEVPYRGHEGALYRRDYGRLFQEVDPSLTLVDTGRLSASDGFDDVTWWLFRKA